MKKLYLSLLTGALLISGCASKGPKAEHELKKDSLQKVYLIIDSPGLKYESLSFVKKDEKGIHIYAVNDKTHKFYDIDIRKEDICVRDNLSKPSWFSDGYKCVPKNQFSEKILKVNYPGTLLENIVNGAQIYNGDHSWITTNGLRQTIIDRGHDIDYRVSEKESFFRDRISNVKVVLQIKDFEIKK